MVGRWGVEGAEVVEVLVGGVGGGAGRAFAVIAVQQGRVTVDGCGKGSVGGDGGVLRCEDAGRAVVPGLLAEAVAAVAVVVDGQGGDFVDGFAAEDVPEGIVAKAVGLEVFFVVGFEVEGAVFLKEAIAVAGGGIPDRLARNPGRADRAGVSCRGRAGISGFRGRFNFRGRGRGVEAAAEEFLGGGEAMVGLEAGKVALHHVHEEADGGAAVVGFFEDQVGQGLVGVVLRRAQDERVWIPACAVLGDPE